MTVEEARKIPGKGPQVGPQQGQGGFFAGRGGGGCGPAAPGARRGAERGSWPGGAAADAVRRQGSGYNSIFVGSKGYMGTSGRGEGVGLLPGSRWAEYKLPEPYLQRSPGASTGSNHAAHCRDWVRACKGGAPACSNFSIASKYTEWLVLGAAAVHQEGKLMWDNAKGEFTNDPEANQVGEADIPQGLGAETLKRWGVTRVMAPHRVQVRQAPPVEVPGADIAPSATCSNELWSLRLPAMKTIPRAGCAAAAEPVPAAGRRRTRVGYDRPLPVSRIAPNSSRNSGSVMSKTLPAGSRESKGTIVSAAAFAIKWRWKALTMSA